MKDLNDDLIQSVKNVFSKAIRYTIPPYQRGYKWNRGNVIKLLDDLKNFESGNASSPQSFYCIQNITIVPLDDTEWNVVDGQQRLTTLYILLSFLRKFQKSTILDFFHSPDCLKYAVREETGAFLKKDIYNGSIWDGDIEPDKAKFKDEWYILDVAKGIKDWFDTDGNSLKVETVTDRLKIIVNIMSGRTVSEEEIFAGLNGGKVDLDGTDLVRAELITRSAKEKYQNALAQKVKEFRMRIAIELDEMSLWWGNKEQATYFKQFLPENFKDNVFNHDIHPLGLLYKLYFLIHQDEGESFGIEFFENGRNFNGVKGDDHWELYESVMSLHHTLRMWFTDSILYHWIGYIMFRFKGQNLDSDMLKTLRINKEKSASVGFSLIWMIWKISSSKDNFIGMIIALVKSLITHDDDELTNNIRALNRQWYGVNPKGITDVLVLMDVMKCTGIYKDFWKDEDKNEVKALTIAGLRGKLRLPASYFTRYREDLEHIRSCAPNPEEGKEERRKTEWISHISSIYNDVKQDSDEYKMKSALLEILNNYANDELDDATIIKLNQKMNEYGQNSIGNMALLDSHVNRGYKNAPFHEKIQRIFSEYMNDNRYIRPYTMIVFEHKIDDPDKSWRWTMRNIEENARNIANNVEQLTKFEL